MSLSNRMALSALFDVNTNGGSSIVPKANSGLCFGEIVPSSKFKVQSLPPPDFRVIDGDLVKNSFDIRPIEMNVKMVETAINT